MDRDLVVGVRERLLGALFDPSTPRVAVAVLALGLVFPLLLLAQPLVVVNVHHWDLFVPLDGAWRVYLGQSPNVDFHSPVGPLYYLAYGLAMKLYAPDARPVVSVPAVEGTALALLAVVATRGGRLPAVLRVPAVLWVGLLAMSPAEPDLPGGIGFASYNRLGWAISVVVALATLFPQRDRAVRDDAVDGAVVAFLLAFGFYLKITLFGFAVGVVLVALALVPGSRRAALLGLAGAAALIAVPFALSAVPAAYIRDLIDTIHSRDAAWDARYGEGVEGPAKLAADLGNNVPQLLLPVLATLFALRARPEQEREIGRIGLVAGAVLVGAMLVGTQSHDNEIPALLVGSLVVVAGAVRLGLRTPSTAVVGAAMLVLLGLPIWRDASGVVAAWQIASADDHTWTLATSPTSPGARIRFFYRPDGPQPIDAVLDGTVTAEVYDRVRESESAADVPVLLVEGQRALDQYAPADARILSATFASPFPFFRGAPASEGALSWYHPGRTFGGTHPLDPATFLADCDVFLVPRVHGGLLETDAIWSMVGETVERDFERHDTPLWTVWVRHPAP